MLFLHGESMPFFAITNLSKNSEGYILHNLTLETNAEAMCDNEPMCIILAPHKKVGKENKQTSSLLFPFRTFVALLKGIHTVVNIRTNH